MTVERSCMHCRDHLIEFAAGSLPPADAAAVQQHLATCADCRRELAAWRTLAETMEMRNRQTPPDLDSRVLTGWQQLEAALPMDFIGDARQHTWGDGDVVSHTVLRDEPTAHSPITGPSSLPPRQRRSVRLYDRLLPALVATLVITLGVTLFGVLAHRDHSHPSVATQPPTCASNQISARLPKGTRLIGLAMTSPDNGWAVGDTYDSAAPPPFFTSLILHYSHCQWAPEPIRLLGIEFYRISAVSADDVWVLGYKLTTRPDAQPLRLTSLVMHYTGGQWRETPLPIAIADNQIIDGFSMVGSDEGWMEVAQLGANNVIVPPYQLYHGVKGIWSGVSASGYHELWLVKAFAPGEAWLIGRQNTSSTQSILLLYRNGTITPLYSLPATARLIQSGQIPSGQIQMDSPVDAWVSLQTLTNGAPSGWQLLQCSLSSCRQSSLLDDPRIQASDDVWVFSATEGWAFNLNVPAAAAEPQTDRQSGIFRLHNGQWQRTSTAFSLDSVHEILYVQQVSPDEYWATTPAGLLHFANGSWSMFA